MEKIKVKMKPWEQCQVRIYRTGRYGRVYFIYVKPRVYEVRPPIPQCYTWNSALVYSPCQTLHGCTCCNWSFRAACLKMLQGSSQTRSLTATATMCDSVAVAGRGAQRWAFPAAAARPKPCSCHLGVVHLARLCPVWRMCDI